MQRAATEIADSQGLELPLQSVSAKQTGVVSAVLRGQAALVRLLEAHQCARELQRSPWDFAVEIDELRRMGCSNSELRWLICKGLAAQATEVVPSDSDRRTFQRSGDLIFNERTCFTLTEKGLPIAANQATRRAQVAASPPALPAQPSTAEPEDEMVPTWDDDRQELRLGNVVIKRFKVPAANQQRILAAFEEEQWPVRIDDPLPPTPDQLPKRRLHDTINSLNRNQLRPLIRFLGDGRGEGVRWRLVTCEGNEQQAYGGGSRGI